MLKLLKNKRGEEGFWAADTWPFYLIFGIILNVVFLIFLLGINSNAEAKTKIPDGLEEISVNIGFLFSEDCFLYSDNGIIRAYELDFNKFNEFNLNNCAGDKQPIKLTLKLGNKEKVIKTNHYFEARFNEIKEEYKKLLEAYKWNELVYNSEFRFEPIKGNIYHLYQRESDKALFLSLIGPDEWNQIYIGSFRMDSNDKWTKVE